MADINSADKNLSSDELLTYARKNSSTVIKNTASNVASSKSYNKNMSSNNAKANKAYGANKVSAKSSAKKINKKRINSKNKKKNNKPKSGGAGDFFMSLGGNVIRLAIDIILYMVLIIALVYCCKRAYTFCFQVFGSSPMTTKENAYSMSFSVSEGESTMDIAKRLENYELIPDRYSFVVKAKLDKSSIKPGTFIISSDMDYDDILEIISDFSQAVDEDKVGETIKNEAEGSE